MPAKKVVAKKKAAEKAPDVPRGTFCLVCKGPCDVSQRSGDDTPKARCMNEQCPKYGEAQ